MKRVLYIVALILGFEALTQSPKTMEKIEAAKIALITQRLDLTPEQAEKFWPIYNEYSNRRIEVHREFQQLRRDFNPNTATEEESKKMLETGMRMKERQLQLDRDYSQRMLQVINARQLAGLRKAEEDFRQMVLDRVRDQDRLRQQRMRNDQDRERRRN